MSGDGGRRGLYTASRTHHASKWRAFRDEGYPIISTWIDEAGEGESASLIDLWERNIAEASTAHALILYAEPSDFPLKGALIEIGAALASGVPVFAVLPDVELEPRSLRPVGSWLLHPLVRRRSSIRDTLYDAMLAARERDDG